MIIDNLIQIGLLLLNFSLFFPLVIIYNNHKFIKYNNYFLDNKDNINNIVGYSYFLLERMIIYLINLLMHVGIIKKILIDTNKTYIYYDNKLFNKLNNFISENVNYLIRYTLSGNNVFKIMELCINNKNNNDKSKLDKLDGLFYNKKKEVNNILDDIKTKIDLSDSDKSSDDITDEEYTDNIKKNN